jgi:putative CocE/NonD family hydrolase
MGRILGAACALALAAGGTALVSSPAADAAANAPAVSGPTPVWLGYTRLPDYQTASSEIRVPMTDYTQMRCTLTRPTFAGLVLSDQRPVIIVNFFAYRALQPIMAMAEYYASRGYVALSCSPRGSGGTAGTWAPLQSQEARDNYTLIEWAAKQPWSNGKVGQTGISYGGISTIKAVATNPPHLKAAIPIVAYQDVYREMVYPGGVRGTALRWWPYFTWGTSIADQTPDASLATLPQYADFETKAAAHPLYDGYWKDLAVDIKAVNKTKIPILDVGGWNDLFPEGTVRNFLGARDQSWLLMGPGAHGEFVPGVPQYDAMQGGMLAFFDHILMGRSDAHLPDTKVTSWEMPRGTGGWVQMDDYPVTTPNKLNLAGPQGSGVATQFTYAANPFDNGCLCVEHGVYNSTEYPFNDQRLSDQQRVQFTGAPTAGDVVIAGAPVAHIKASFSTPDGVLVVRLEDVAPDGTSTVITSGWMKASKRLGPSSSVPVSPGQPGMYDIALLPTHWRVWAGHALRITISSGDIQMIEPYAAPGSTVTIYAGKDGSTFELPIYR